MSAEDGIAFQKWTHFPSCQCFLWEYDDDDDDDDDDGDDDGNDDNDDDDDNDDHDKW